MLPIFHPAAAIYDRTKREVAVRRFRGAARAARQTRRAGRRRRAEPDGARPDLAVLSGVRACPSAPSRPRARPRRERPATALAAFAEPATYCCSPVTWVQARRSSPRVSPSVSACRAGHQPHLQHPARARGPDPALPLRPVPLELGRAARGPRLLRHPRGRRSVGGRVGRPIRRSGSRADGSS